MKPHRSLLLAIIQFVLPMVITGLGLMLAGRVIAQTFTTLHIFDGSDGSTLYAALTLSGDTLYGTTY
jgi:hypothetical protein